MRVVQVLAQHGHVATHQDLHKQKGKTGKANAFWARVDSGKDGEARARWVEVGAQEQGKESEGGIKF